MNMHHILVIITAVFFAVPFGASAEEHYTETKNCVRIFDWDTLDLLMNTKIPKVNINAKTGDELILQINKALEGIKELEGLKIDYKRDLWERQMPDGTIEKSINADVELRLVNIPLLKLIRYICDANKMTFSVKKGEILFRPLIG